MTKKKDVGSDWVPPPNTKNEVKCQQSFTSLEGADKSAAISAKRKSKRL